MFPGADEIAEKVYDRLSDLHEETTDLVVCAVAMAIMRGSYLILCDLYTNEMGGMPLSDFMEKVLSE